MTFQLLKDAGKHKVDFSRLEPRSEFYPCHGCDDKLEAAAILDIHFDCQTTIHSHLSQLGIRKDRAAVTHGYLFEPKACDERWLWYTCHLLLKLGPYRATNVGSLVERQEQTADKRIEPSCLRRLFACVQLSDKLNHVFGVEALDGRPVGGFVWSPFLVVE